MGILGEQIMIVKLTDFSFRQGYKTRNFHVKWTSARDKMKNGLNCFLSGKFETPQNQASSRNECSSLFSYQATSFYWFFPPFKRRIPRFLNLIKLFPPSVSLPFHFNQVHLLQNNPKQTLGRGDDDWFLILTPQHLGRITHIKLWSSYSGGQPDWYCYKVEVRDFDTRQKYLFFVQRWLSVLQDTEWWVQQYRTFVLTQNEEENPSYF